MSSTPGSMTPMGNQTPANGDSQVQTEVKSMTYICGGNYEFRKFT